MEWTRRTVTGGLAATILPLHPDRAVAKPATEPVVLEAAPAKLRLLKPPAPETAVWAYNGQVPGPVIRVTPGSEAKIRLVNKLEQPTSLCWHGVRIANAMDGVVGLTQAAVKPGESYEYRFTPPDAGLYWYHPHVFPFSAEQIARGLYGLLIVEGDRPPVDQDVLIVLADWALDDKGQIAGRFPDPQVAASEGRVGTLVTVNAQPAPATPIQVAPGARVRLRIVNVCAARIAIITLVEMAASIIAIDGQPSEVFPPAGNSVPIGPGSRFDLIAEMPREPGRTPALILRGSNAPDQPLLTFVTKGTPAPAQRGQTRLAANPLLPTRIPLEKALKPTIVIDAARGPTTTPVSTPGKSKPEPEPMSKTKSKPETKSPDGVEPSWLWTLNGAGSDGFSGKPLFRVKARQAVSLTFVNKTKFVQQMHLHGHVFRVLHDLDDGWDPYWRESILIGPAKTKHIAFIADNPGKWAIESLTLDRQITGLAGWFEVG